MAVKSIADMDIRSRRVFIRVDFDVPLTPAGGVSDVSRIRDSLPTIKHAVDRGARVVLASHLGWPKGKPSQALSLMPVAACLVDMLDHEVVLTDEPVGDGAKKVVSDLREGHIAMLENLRFAAGEEANDEAFARALAAYADIYVNDALTSAYLAHASTAGTPRFVSEKGMGLGLEREVKALGRLMGEVERPFVAVIGGSKFSDRIGFLKSLLGRVDALLLGGAIAHSFLKARGGRSFGEEDNLALARDFLARAEQARVDVVLPSDLVVADESDARAGRIVSSTRVPDDLFVLDIGPETVQRFSEHLARARTVFWDGPMGAFISPASSDGTVAIAKAVAAVRFGLTVASGREAATALDRAGATDRVTHISTSGLAALEFMTGKKFPGLAALES